MLLFSEAPIRADLLWEQRLLRHSSPMQMKSVASSLLDFKDFQAHDAIEEKITSCHILTAVSWIHLFICSFEADSDSSLFHIFCGGCFLGKIIELVALHQLEFLAAAWLVYLQNLI